MTKEQALAEIKVLRDKINAIDTKEHWVNNVVWFLDKASDVIEFPK